MDYFDADVAYLLGLITARGQILEQPSDYRIIIQFPGSAITVQGVQTTFDQPTEIKLGLLEIGNRLRTLLETDIDLPTSTESDDHTLVISFRKRNMIWRNLRLILGEASHFGSFEVPEVVRSTDTPVEYVREYLRGFADVAGNVRPANRYVDGRNRVRLDILNYPTNWRLPVQLCHLLQERLEVPVQLITWGHPNLGRDFREHQINVFAVPFLKVGFTFRHKQRVLEELAEQDTQNFPQAVYLPCLGERKISRLKSADPREQDSSRLPPELVGRHFDAYWQICRALGCPRRPAKEELTLLEDVEDESAVSE